MSVAELLILLLVVLGVSTLLRPLRRAIGNGVRRLMGRSKPGTLIEGSFRPVNRNPKDRS